MVTVDRVVVELEAKIDAYNARVAKSQIEFDRRTKSIERSAQRMEQNTKRSFDRAGQNIRNFVSAIAIGAVIRETGKLADVWTEAGNRIAAASQIAGIQARSLEELRRGADSARSAFEPYVELYSRILRSTRGVAESEEQVALATNIAAKAFKAGGAAATEQAAGVLQLSQALGSGVLQGDELRSLRENAPLIAEAIAQEFNTTIAGLKKLGEEGKLTSDRVFNAIIKAQPQIEAAFSTTNATIADSFTRLRGSLIEYIGTSESVRTAAETVSGAIAHVADNFEDFADAAIIAAGVIGGPLASRALGKLVSALGEAATAELQYRTALATGNAVAIDGAVATRQRAEAAVADSVAQLEAAAAAERRAAAEVQGTAALQSGIRADIDKANAVLRTTAAEAAAAQAERNRAAALVASDTARKAQLASELEYQQALRASGAANQVRRIEEELDVARLALVRSTDTLATAEIRLAAAEAAHSGAQKALVGNSLELAAAQKLAGNAAQGQAVATAELTAAQAAAARTSDALTVATGRASLGARAAAVAFTAFNRVLGFFGGPVGAAIFAIGAAVTFASLRAREAAVSFDDFDKTLDSFNKTLKEVDSDQDRLASLQALLDKNEDITEAIQAQGFASREALALEVDSINKRIAKNQELAETYKATLRIQIAALEESTRASSAQLSVFRKEQRELLARKILAGRGAPLVQGKNRTDEELDTIISKRGEELILLAQQGKLTKDQAKDLQIIQQIQEDNLRLAKARAALEQLGVPTEAPSLPPRLVPPISADDLRENERLLKRINDSYNDLFDTELAGIQRVRQERTKDVQESKLTAKEKADAILKIDRTAAEETRLLQKQLAEDEKFFVEDALDSRDRAAGRVLSIAQREFEARKFYIDQEIEELRRRGSTEVELEKIKNDALARLAEEHAEFERRVRIGLPGQGQGGEIAGLPTQDSVDEEIRQVIDVEAAKLEALQDAFDAQIIAQEEFEARRINVIIEAEEEIANIRAKAAQLQLNSASNSFGKLASATERFLGDQSAAYQALFAVQKAFSIASAIVATRRGVAEALGRYPPDYLTAALIAGSGAAEVATILAQGFADGGKVSGPGTGKSDSIPARLSDGEFVSTSEATRRNQGALEAGNRGARLFAFANGGIVGRSPNASIPSVAPGSGGAGNQMPQLPAPEVNVTNINTFDPAQALSAALGVPAGNQVFMNFVQRNQVGLRAALGLGARNGA